MKRIDSSDDKSSPPPTPPTEDMAFAHAKETNNLGDLFSLLTEKKAAAQTVRKTVLIGDKLFLMEDIELANKRLIEMVADTRV